MNVQGLSPLVLTPLRYLFDLKASLSPSSPGPQLRTGFGYYHPESVSMSVGQSHSINTGQLILQHTSRRLPSLPSSYFTCVYATAIETPIAIYDLHIKAVLEAGMNHIPSLHVNDRVQICYMISAQLLKISRTPGRISDCEENTQESESLPAQFMALSLRLTSNHLSHCQV